MAEEEEFITDYDSDDEAYADALETMTTEDDITKGQRPAEHSNKDELQKELESLKIDIDKDRLLDKNGKQTGSVDVKDIKSEEFKTASDAMGAQGDGDKAEIKCDADEKTETNQAGDEDNDEEESEEEEEKKDDQDVDEEALKVRDETLTEEEVEEFKIKSQELKASGNKYFTNHEFEEAIESYTEALKICPLRCIKERSIMYSNRAACKLHMESNEDAIKDCTKALELHPNYMKALLRRAELYEKTDKLDEALADYQRALEMDPSLIHVRQACMRLPDQINERNEKLKTEMMGKLKDLGNLVLRPFGLSTANFNFEQNPETGSYSVNFQQNANPAQPPQQPEPTNEQQDVPEWAAGDS